MPLLNQLSARQVSNPADFACNNGTAPSVGFSVKDNATQTQHTYNLAFAGNSSSALSSDVLNSVLALCKPSVAAYSPNCGTSNTQDCSTLYNCSAPGVPASVLVATASLGNDSVSLNGDFLKSGDSFQACARQNLGSAYSSAVGAASPSSVLSSSSSVAPSSSSSSAVSSSSVASSSSSAVSSSSSAVVTPSTTQSPSSSASQSASSTAVSTSGGSTTAPVTTPSSTPAPSLTTVVVTAQPSQVTLPNPAGGAETTALCYTLGNVCIPVNATLGATVEASIIGANPTGAPAQASVGANTKTSAAKRRAKVPANLDNLLTKKGATAAALGLLVLTAAFA